MSEQSHGKPASTEFSLESVKKVKSTKKVNNISVDQRKEIFNIYESVDREELLKKKYLKDQVVYMRSLCKNIYCKNKRKEIAPDIAAFLKCNSNSVTKTYTRLEKEDSDKKKPKPVMGRRVKIDREVLKQYITEAEKKNAVTTHEISALSQQLFNTTTNEEEDYESDEDYHEVDEAMSSENEE
ncbi:hypothetical protein QTN25_010077 [Entamoeba marina]